MTNVPGNQLPPSAGGAKPSNRMVLFTGCLVVLVVLLIVALLSKIVPGDSSGTPAAASPAAGSEIGGSPSATSPVALVPLRPLKRGDVSVHCTISPAPHPGAVVTLTYQLHAEKAGTVGLGAGIYRQGGDETDYGNDDAGDEDSYRLQAGAQSVSRPLHLPTGLKSGTYQIAGEVWPTGDVGTGDTLTDQTCAPTMTVR